MNAKLQGIEPRKGIDTLTFDPLDKGLMLCYANLGGEKMDKVEVIYVNGEEKYILNGELVLDKEEFWEYVLNKARKYIKANDDNNDDE